MRVEADIARRGWMPALSPADADVLVVCGVPGLEFESVRDRIWSQLPGPRARADLIAADSVSAALDSAAERLIDTAWQVDDARNRDRKGSRAAHGHPPESQPHAGAMPMAVPMPEDSGHAGMDMSAHNGMDMSGHEGMDMDMASPGGIPLASGGDDRDGLEMDVLNVPFGPVLSHWPAGLVMRCVLHGDVIVTAQVHLLGAGANPPGDSEPDGEARSRAIRLCDDAFTLLSLAGWPSGASAAVRARNELLRGGALAESAIALARLRRRVTRSWLLRWSLSGIRTAGSSAMHAQDAHDPDAGDIRHRLIEWLTEAEGICQSEVVSTSGHERHEQALLLSAIPGLVEGMDVASARLAIAGLGLHTAALAEVEVVAHG